MLNLFGPRRIGVHRDDYVELSGKQLRHYVCRVVMDARSPDELMTARDVLDHLIERHRPGRGGPLPNQRHDQKGGDNKSQNHNHNNRNSKRPS